MITKPHLDGKTPTQAMVRRAISMTCVGAIISAMTAAQAMDGYDEDTRDSGHWRGACSRTAVLAKTACGHDVLDDFFIAKGNCVNLSDPFDRDECRGDARATRQEDRELCGEQYKARLDVCDLLGENRYDPQIVPEDFVDPLAIGDSVAENPYLPLIPGLTRIYESGDETITVTVTDETTEILGVTCIVVRDVVEEDGEIIEDTVDWYAQDVYGNVWYFGEIAQNFEDGKLADLDGSWEAGVDGAKPGVLMAASPAVGDVYRQEWALGEAEDLGEVLSTSASESAPAASCSGDCVQTRDFTPIEPDVNEHKFYAPGIGVIVAYDTDDPTAREELVDYFFN